MKGNTLYNNFVSCASGLPGGFIVGQKEDVPYDITDLLNGYCSAKDSDNDLLKSQYASALLVRYWHMAVMLYKTSQSTRLDFDEIVMWIYEAIEKACKYRSWKDSTKAVSKDPKGAEKVLNRCITSVRQFWYKNFNQDKRKINFLITDSLDDVTPYNDTETPIIDTIEDPSASISIDQGRDFVQKYIDEGKLFEALVLEGIMYQDSFIDSEETSVVGQDEEGEDIEVTKYSSEFSMIKFKKLLRGIDDKFICSFADIYNVDVTALVSLADEIKKLSKAQLTTKVNRTFKVLQQNKELMAWIQQ